MAYLGGYFSRTGGSRLGTKLAQGLASDEVYFLATTLSHCASHSEMNANVAN